MPVALDYNSDHVVIRLVNRRVSIVVPYSTIARVEVEGPRPDSPVEEWPNGNVPKLVTLESFSERKRESKRFLHCDKTTSMLLTLHLEGHPDYDEVRVEVRDPHAAREELAKRARR